MVLYFFGVVSVITIALVSSETYICENTKDELSCPTGQILNITNALYGRQNATICPSTRNVTAGGNCTAQNATDFVASLCNKMQNCTVYFNGTDFEDSCRNVTKYLSVNYECINVTATTCGPHEQYSSVVCDCLNQCQTPDFSCSDFCSKDGGCICSPGYRKDPITGKCVCERFCPQGGDLNHTHEVFGICANHQPTCRFPFRWRRAPCEPGYECARGFIRDVYSQQCIRPDECPRAYPRRWRK